MPCAITLEPSSIARNLVLPATALPWTNGGENRTIKFVANAFRTTEPGGPHGVGRMRPGRPWRETAESVYMRAVRRLLSPLPVRDECCGHYIWDLWVEGSNPSGALRLRSSTVEQQPRKRVCPRPCRHVNLANAGGTTHNPLCESLIVSRHEKGAVLASGSRRTLPRSFHRTCRLRRSGECQPDYMGQAVHDCIALHAGPIAS